MYNKNPTTTTKNKISFIMLKINYLQIFHYIIGKEIETQLHRSIH